MNERQQQVIKPVLRRLEKEKHRSFKRRIGIAVLILTTCLILLTIVEIARGAFPLFPALVVLGTVLSWTVHGIRMLHARMTASKELKEGKTSA